MFFLHTKPLFTRVPLPQQLLMDKRVGLKRYELNGRKVLFYFDEVSLIQILPYCVHQGSAHVEEHCICVVMVDEERVIQQCLHSVGENFVFVCKSVLVGIFVSVVCISMCL